MSRQHIIAATLVTALWAGPAVAQDKVPLEPPTIPARAIDDDLLRRLKDMPDGVLEVKTDPDGTFKSLVVKAVVEIDSALGADKGKRSARTDAEMQCKKALAKWLGESCEFSETQDKTVQITTRGESTKDAAGNTVQLRKQDGVEVKVTNEHSRSLSSAVVQGLTVLQCEVTAATPAEYVLVMGLSKQTVAKSKAVRDALTGKAGSAAVEGVTAGDTSDRPSAEVKTNPDAKDF